MVKKYYSACLDLEGKNCLVIGGGRIAKRKVQSLLDVGAAVTVVSPGITEELKGFVRNRNIHFLKRKFKNKDIHGAFLIISATDDKELNRHISSLAQRRGILVNVVDSADTSNFIVPASFRQGSLHISVSTGGTLPALSRRICRQLKTSYGKNYRTFLDWVAGTRQKVLESIPIQKQRKKIFYSLCNPKIINLLNNKKQKQAKKEFDRILRSSE